MSERSEAAHATTGADSAGIDRPVAAERPESARAFWIGLAVGLPILVVGVRGALENSRDVRPTELARWIVGSAIVHDGLVVPLVAVVGVIGHRWVPRWAWPAVRWALFTTAVLLVVSRPYVAGYGYNPSNPTALARDYGQGVAVAIALVWGAAAIWAARLRITKDRVAPTDRSRSITAGGS